MQPKNLLFVIIGIIIVNFIFEKIINLLNTKYFDNQIPERLKDIYDENEYKKSQEYKKTNALFSNLTSAFSIVLTLLFFYFEGFKYLDQFARTFSNNSISIGLIFFAIIIIGSDILTIPFSYYKTFVIEEKFDFNRTSKKTFWLDKLKGWLMTLIFGGIILSSIIWFYEQTGEKFWIYTWILTTFFSIFINLFYSKLIVPLFNKQIPLENGELKSKIESYAETVGFKVSNIFVIDGSKRSTKANAYFSGFGSQKRITLFDTLINDLETDEIVAVLAHEVGHYKKKHIIFNLITSTLLTGLTLYILSLFVNSLTLSQALGVSVKSFHVNLIAFGVLYSPISEITGLLMNYVSRKFEFQADNYAKNTFDAKPLISSLKKLSKKSLSNLTPHPAYVFVHYSHPTLLQRIKNLEN